MGLLVTSSTPLFFSWIIRLACSFLRRVLDWLSSPELIPAAVCSHGTGGAGVMFPLISLLTCVYPWTAATSEASMSACCWLVKSPPRNCARSKLLWSALSPDKLIKEKSSSNSICAWSSWNQNSDYKLRQLVGASGFCKLGVVNCCNLQIVLLMDCNAALVFILMCSWSWEGTSMLRIFWEALILYICCKSHNLLCHWPLVCHLVLILRKKSWNCDFSLPPTLFPFSPHFYQPLILAQKVCDEETEEVIYMCGRSHGRAFQEYTKTSMEPFEACDGVYTFFVFNKMVYGGGGWGQWVFAESMIQMLGVNQIFL